MLCPQRSKIRAKVIKSGLKSMMIKGLDLSVLSETGVKEDLSGLMEEIF